nr:MAG TPA: hypothetical protein [Caudoviricetes sp.]
MNSFHFYFLLSLFSFERRFLSSKVCKIICSHYLPPISLRNNFFLICTHSLFMLYSPLERRNLLCPIILV